MNGLIVEVTTDKPLRGQLPHWDLIYKLPRDRLRFRQTLRAIKNLISACREITQVEEQEPIPIRERALKSISAARTAETPKRKRRPSRSTSIRCIRPIRFQTAPRPARG